MGIREDRLNWAADTERLAKIMFDRTKNPYFALMAIHASRVAEWASPDWAVNLLLEAAATAYESKMPVGIDESLGLRVGRGKTPPDRLAIRDLGII